MADIFLTSLNSDDVYFRREAFHGLSSFGENIVVPLITILEDKNQSENLRVNSAQLLGDIGDKRAIVPLLNLLAEPKRLRLSAIAALGEIGGEEVFEVLAEQLKDSDFDIKLGVVNAAHKLNDVRFKNLFFDLLKTEDLPPRIPVSITNYLNKFEDEKITDYYFLLLKSGDIYKGHLASLYFLRSFDITIWKQVYQYSTSYSRHLAYLRLLELDRANILDIAKEALENAQTSHQVLRTLLQREDDEGVKIIIEFFNEAEPKIQMTLAGQISSLSLSTLNPIEENKFSQFIPVLVNKYQSFPETDEDLRKLKENFAYALMLILMD
jgi:hypothetical protein